MPRRLSLPLTLLLAQGCTSVLVVGDRDDAAATPDQPLALDRGEATPDTDDRDAGGPDVADGLIVEPACVDRDGDHYGLGLGCTNVDCDDANAAVTDQCYCGRLPNTREGCECRLGDPPRPCDVDSGRTYSASETCNVGQRTCDPIAGRAEVGAWSVCRAWRADYPVPVRFVGVVSQCAGNCSPGCRHQVVCPEAGDPIPAGSTDVVVADAAHAVFCPGTSGIRGGITSACTTAAGGATACRTGTYDRVYVGATCTDSDAPYWGQFNFTSIVPPGTTIEFRVRVAQTRDALASAPWTRLANAPSGSPVAPSSLDVGAAIRAQLPTVVGADHFEVLELQATLVPSPDGALAPTLISTEVQFTCAGIPDPACRAGSQCFIASNPCRLARIECFTSAGGRVVEVCTDSGAAPPGTACGPGAVCTAAGACVACPSRSAEVCDNADNNCDGAVDEGLTEACYTGPAGTAGVGACHTGRRTCAAGAWGECADQVVPTTEVCDALDNDCNGALNNGILCP